MAFQPEKQAESNNNKKPQEPSACSPACSCLSSPPSASGLAVLEPIQPVVLAGSSCCAVRV